MIDIDIKDDTEVALNTVAASAAKVAYIQSIRGQDSNDEDGMFAATVSAIWWIIMYDGDRTFALKGWGCPKKDCTGPDGSVVKCCNGKPVKGNKCKPCGTRAPSVSSGISTTFKLGVLALFILVKRVNDLMSCTRFLDFSIIFQFD